MPPIPKIDISEATTSLDINWECLRREMSKFGDTEVIVKTYHKSGQVENTITLKFMDDRDRSFEITLANGEVTNMEINDG